MHPGNSPQTLILEAHLQFMTRIQTINFIIETIQIANSWASTSTIIKIIKFKAIKIKPGLKLKKPKTSKTKHHVTLLLDRKMKDNCEILNLLQDGVK